MLRTIYGADPSVDGNVWGRRYNHELRANIWGSIVAIAKDKPYAMGPDMGGEWTRSGIQSAFAMQTLTVVREGHLRYE